MPILSHFSASPVLPPSLLEWPSLLEQLPPKETRGAGRWHRNGAEHGALCENSSDLSFHFPQCWVVLTSMFSPVPQCQRFSPYNLCSSSPWVEWTANAQIILHSTETIPSVIYYLSRGVSLKSAMQIRRQIPTHTQSAEWIWSQTAEDTCRGGQKTVRVLPRETDMAAE